jgi:hypothetical protein
MADERNIPPQSREELQRIVVRLLGIAGRCEEHAMRYQLMQLADELMIIVDQIKR